MHNLNPDYPEWRRKYNFPLTPISDWDSYNDEYESQKRREGLQAFTSRMEEKAKARKAEEEAGHDEDHPRVLSPEYWERDRERAERDLHRFLAKRGLRK